MTDEPLTDARRRLDGLVGATLHEVVYVEDYLQLRLTGAMLTIVNGPVLLIGKEERHWGAKDFSDRLSEAVGSSVARVDYVPANCIEIAFETGHSLRISLKDEDYEADEAAILATPEGEMVF